MIDELGTIYAILGSVGGATAFIVHDKIYKNWEKMVLFFPSMLCGIFGSGLIARYGTDAGYPEAKGLVALAIAYSAMSLLDLIKESMVKHLKAKGVIL